MHRPSSNLVTQGQRLLCPHSPMAETEEFASAQSDVCKRRLCGFAFRANHVAAFKSFWIMYAFMYAFKI